MNWPTPRCDLALGVLPMLPMSTPPPRNWRRLLVDCVALKHEYNVRPL